MTLPTPEQRARGEAPLALVVLLALMTSVIAMTIDAVLPALDAIAADLAFAEENDRQLVIMAVFAGMAVSQPVFGPLSDAIGRREAALIGWAIFTLGSVVCLAAPSAEAMLLGRFLQGVGAGGPRIIAVAMIRDLYEGRAMARLLSLVMTLFMLVPITAPLIGQGVEALGGWRAIFWLYLALAAISAGWLAFAMEDTLPPEKRTALSARGVARGFAEVLSNRVAMLYTASAACVFAPFLVYLMTSQQVLEEAYALGPLFPLVFGLLAIAFAAASFLNSRLVMALGMRRISLIATAALIVTSAAGTLLTREFALGALPPLPVFMGLMALVFLSVAVLFANFNALALQPLGHIAGTASALVMSLATLGAAPLAGLISRGFDGSLSPLFTGFLGLGLAGLLLMWLAERGRPPEPVP